VSLFLTSAWQGRTAVFDSHHSFLLAYPSPPSTPYPTNSAPNTPIRIRLLKPNPPNSIKRACLHKLPLLVANSVSHKNKRNITRRTEIKTLFSDCIGEFEIVALLHGFAVAFQVSSEKFVTLRARALILRGWRPRLRILVAEEWSLKRIELYLWQSHENWRVEVRRSALI
ncbi:hypothetical protein CI102_14975, partial [Trichoderma harzianum]